MLEPGYLRSSWHAASLRLHLDQEILLTMERQARWRIACGEVAAAEPPSYLNVMDPRPLADVADERITICGWEHIWQHNTEE